MSEFCPKCGKPLQVTPEPDRLCLACGWWGGQCEALTKPPHTGELATSVMQALDLYRDICRKELLVELACEHGNVERHEMQEVRGAVASCLESLLRIFGVAHPEVGPLDESEEKTE
jgi:hypothetical protein